MPNKYSHSVVLANYSSRGIISLSSEEQLDKSKSLATPRLLAGALPPQPQQFMSTAKSRARASSDPLVHARSSTLNPTSTTPRSSKLQSVIFPCAITTPQQSRKDVVSHRNQSTGAIDDTHPPTSERKVIVHSEIEPTAAGMADSDFWPRTSATPHGRPSTGSRLPSPFEPHVESLKFTVEQDPFRAEAKSAYYPMNAIFKPEQKLLSPLAAQKYERRKGLRGAARPQNRDDLPLSWLGESLQDGYAEPLLSIREFLASSPRLAAGDDNAHSIFPQATCKYDTVHKTPGLQAAAQISKHQTPRRQSLNRACINFTNLSNDEVSENIHGHIPQTPPGKSPSANTSILETGVPNPSILKPAEVLPNLHDEFPLVSMLHTRDKFGNEATLRRGPTEPQARRRPFSLGSCELQTARLQKRAMLCGKKTEEAIGYLFSHGPVVESRHLSWLPPDVGVNAQMTDELHDEARTLLQLSKSEARADVTSASPVPSAAQPDQPEFQRVEADFSKLTDDYEDEEVCDPMDDVMPNICIHRRSHEWIDDRLLQNDSSPKMSPPLSQKPKLKPELKSEEEIRMKIPTPIPSPSLPAMSPKRSARRMVKSLPGSVYQVSRPVTMPEFGVPSIVRYDDQTEHIHEPSTSRPNSRWRSLTSQKQKGGPRTLRKLASLSRFPRMGGVARRGKETVPVRTIDDLQQDSDDWTLPNSPVSKKAASRASPPESFAAGEEDEAMPKPIALRLQHQHPLNFSRQFQKVTTERGYTERGYTDEMDDMISLFSNDHVVSVNVQNDYTSSLHTAGDEREDPDAALPPPDISRYRPDRTSYWYGQFRRSQTSLAALPGIAKPNANTSANRRSRAVSENAMPSMFWTLNASSPPPVPPRSEARKAKGENGGRMETGMRTLWGRLRRRMERRVFPP
ncbi:uncharacterized protein Z519_08031 [Cladophialophora bantiana CBS 173.52]|uniref:Uncharacterized protein n=1 Tax=Cladophialophora bantiana (strain ATCC 10958 / CBS 173.52 / CDC B-1940 / NIH 8579) TaxID=1442370 RepID=A0A0D2FXC0_CLAB1|nr:uncharacterized protein Z519_08031 [Cladophialophora bantiana CBS 173.52]KIW91137.1 hypothetical protein Z519_08031 [Cladophialophora bantiana CBS 173.52]